MKLEAKLIALSKELWMVIDTLRGPQGRAAYLEELLWRSRKIKQQAEELRIKPEPRRRQWIRKT